MTETEQTRSRDAVDVLHLARTIRFTLVVIVLGLSYFNLRASLSIDSFRLMFSEMLNGRTLPPLTAFVLGSRHGFLLASILVPLATIGTLFSRRILPSFHLLGALAVVTVTEFITLYHGLTAPISDIVRGMTSTP